MNEFMIHVCGCAVLGAGVVIGTDSGGILCRVRVTGSVVGLAVFGVCVLHSIFTETCIIIIIYVCIDVYVLLMFYM